ncbi:MAG: hypothetical protein COA58_10870, partial [Bacteroidetes bacterium]
MKKDYKRNWRFRFKTVVLVGSMLFAGSSFAQLSGSYTIDAGGSGDFTSFTALADTLTSDGVSGPVVVDVVASSGPYSEWVVFEDASGASATNTITINGNGEKITYTGTSSRSQVITFSDADYYTVDNLVIENTTTNYGRCVQIRDVSTYITINDCELTMPNLTAIYTASTYILLGNGTNTSVYTYANAAEYCVISNNVTSAPVNYGPYWGIFSADVNNNSDTKGNIIDNNEIKNFAYYGIRTYYVDAGSVISNNNIHNTGATTNYTQYGIYAYQYYSGGMTITGNKIHDLRNGLTSTKYGLYYYGYYAVNGTSPALIANNVIDISGGGTVYGMYIYGPYSEQVDVINNTINLMKEPGQNSTGTVYPMYAGYINGTVQNNIIYCDFNKTAGNMYGIFGYDAGALGGTSVFINNDIHLEDVTGGGNVNYADYAGPTYATFDDMTGAFGTDWYNEPVSFVNRSSGDYRITKFGLCNLGVPFTGVTTDIEGITRSITTPDIGATEFDLDFSGSSIDFITNATECGNFSKEIGITIKNENTFPVSDIPVAYEINGGTIVSEIVPGPIAGGASYSYTFANVPTFNTSGTNLVEAYLDGNDDNPGNNSNSYSFIIESSPAGGDLFLSTQFDGYFNSGSLGDPDATVKTYVSVYDISRPTKFSTSGPGPYSYVVTATTVGGGADVTSQGFGILGGSPEKLTINPEISLAGETIWMEIEVTDIGTGCDSAFGRYLYVPHTPVPSFDATDICLGDIAQFKNTSTLGGVNYIITDWDFNDPNAAITDDNSDILNGFWEYSTYGSGVVVEMTVANGVYPKFEYGTSHTINVTPKPEIDFKVLNACEGTPVSIINSTTISNGDLITYSWDFGGEYTSTSSNPSYTFATPGQRKITLNASASGCDASLTKNAYQFEMPIADFSSVGSCNFVDVEF